MHTAAHNGSATCCCRPLRPRLRLSCALSDKYSFSLPFLDLPLPNTHFRCLFLDLSRRHQITVAPYNSWYPALQPHCERAGVQLEARQNYVRPAPALAAPSPHAPRGRRPAAPPPSTPPAAAHNPAVPAARCLRAMMPRGAPSRPCAHRAVAAAVGRRQAAVAADGDGHRRRPRLPEPIRPRRPR